ncbi:hypothetical protein EVAR_32165_1 [Eumeta japonica]|uniref:Uncharacterized protein n=1 Tax=Eumeta variegata TaxID=151549 RepID=A0A4C1VZC2_EUMVA|nr:hypothetical protein EVAR_32165_1 [Eumeta japonica]
MAGRPRRRGGSAAHRLDFTVHKARPYHRTRAAAAPRGLQAPNAAAQPGSVPLRHLGLTNLKFFLSVVYLETALSHTYSPMTSFFRRAAELKSFALLHYALRSANRRRHEMTTCAL